MDTQMITVRFPTGFSVQYNDLDGADFRPTGIYLGKKSDPDNYSVWAPIDCIIEHIAPCRTYWAKDDDVPFWRRALQAYHLKLALQATQHKLDLARKQIERLKSAQKPA
jgi:hypothetical protein